MKIEKIHASTALASLGDETVRVEMTLENGLTSIALVPAGLSAGKYESPRVPAREAVKQITENTAQFLNQEWTQQTLDNQLVELPLAGNSTLAVSAAFWKATQQIKLPHDPSDLKFPQLLVLLFEGAKHGNPKITFQEFLLVEDSVHQAITDFQKMRDYLRQQRGENATVGAEGGFSPSDFDNIKCLNTIKKVFPQKSIALDCAGSFESHGAENYQVLLDNYKIFSIEDPYSDEEWLKWQELYKN